MPKINAILYLRSLFFLIFTFLISPPILALNPPALTGPVVDLANTLQSNEQEVLESKIRSLMSQNKLQAQILIIPSLEGDEIEDFSIKVAEAWKIGNKERDDGIILIVSIQDRKVRIEVGQGLEGEITDLQSNQIIRKVIAPYFKQQKYFEGLLLYIDTISRLTSNEQDSETTSSTTNYQSSGIGNYIPMLVIPFFVLLFVLNFLPAIVRGFIYAVLFPLMSFFVVGGFLGIGFLLMLSFFGFIVGLIGINTLFSRGGRWGGGGGFGGSSGGWSGGGGGFSGGGSSGSW